MVRRILANYSGFKAVQQPANEPAEAFVNCGVGEWEIQAGFREGILLRRLQGSTGSCKLCQQNGRRQERPHLTVMGWKHGQLSSGVGPLPCLWSLRRIAGTGSAELCFLLSQAALAGLREILSLRSACCSLKNVAGVTVQLVLFHNSCQNRVIQECLWEPTKDHSVKALMHGGLHRDHACDT